jgi:hypothetical protein
MPIDWTTFNLPLFVQHNTNLNLHNMDPPYTALPDDNLGIDNPLDKQRTSYKSGVLSPQAEEFQVAYTKTARNAVKSGVIISSTAPIPSGDIISVVTAKRSRGEESGDILESEAYFSDNYRESKCGWLLTTQHSDFR